MAYSVIPKMKKDGTITLKDGTGTPVELVVAYEEGNLTFTPTKAAQVIIRDRNVITNVRQGDEEPSVSGSFSIYLRQFMDASEAGSVLDFVNKTNNYSTNVSTGDTGSPLVEEYCIDIVYSIDGASLSEDNQTATISKAICNVSFSEGEPSVLNIDFIAFGGIAYA